MREYHLVTALIEKDNKILIALKGKGFAKDEWVLPGGKVEPGEDSRDAVIREVKEELNLNSLVKELIGVHKTEGEFQGRKEFYTHHTYALKPLGNPTSSLELPKFKWVPKKTLESKLGPSSQLLITDKVRKYLNTKETVSSGESISIL